MGRLEPVAVNETPGEVSVPDSLVECVCAGPLVVRWLLFVPLEVVSGGLAARYSQRLALTSNWSPAVEAVRLWL